MSWRPTYRGSKFRNVYGKVANREQSFEGIPITKNVHDNHFCAVNSKFVAVVTESAGGGSFIVIPVSQVTRSATALLTVRFFKVLLTHLRSIFKPYVNYVAYRRVLQEDA